jgi:hypothetical protein
MYLYIKAFFKYMKKMLTNLVYSYRLKSVYGYKPYFCVKKGGAKARYG